MKAFPHIEIERRGDPAYTAPTRVYYPGMDLRDYFAGQALAAIGGIDASPDDIAKDCYKIANAMIEQRKKP